MQSPSTPSPAASASTPPGVSFIIVLGSITFLGPLSIHLFFPVMPEVGRALSISPALVGLTFSVTLFVMAFITLVYGSLSDRLGRRPVLLTGLTLFTLGGVLSSFAGSVTGLIVGRVIQALGAGCSATLTRAIAHDAYGSEKLVKIIAYLTMAYTFGPMVAPLVGGVLIDAFGWRSAFWLSSVAGVAILFASWRMIHETHDAAHRRKQAGAAGSGSDGNSSAARRLWRDYRSLLRQPRFLAFVLQTGFSTGTFLAMASGAKSGMNPAVVAISVMSIIFAGAPIVNAIVGIALHPPKGGLSAIPIPFILGILLAALGGFMVTKFKPGSAPPPQKVTRSAAER
jgi:DHA1 family bicyclomycin/chloramphenicol resistance-like MFS transporter